MKLGLAAMALLCLAACDGCRGGAALGPGSVADAGDTYDQCFAACAIRLDAGCEPVSETACERMCLIDQAQGIGAQLVPACVVRAGPDRARLRACGACATPPPEASP